MNIANNPELQQKLAAEYVLGTLRGGARRRFASLLLSDPHLQQVVRQWQEHLMPMMEFSTAQTPRAQVWSNIEQRLKIASTRSWQTLFDFIEPLQFWRGLSLVASTALILVVVFYMQPHDAGTPAAMYVATLNDEQAQPIAVITSDSASRQILLRFVNRPAVASDKSLELWSISKEGKIRSLGLVSNLSGSNKAEGDAVVRINLPDGVQKDTPQLLAISLEPKGGSANPEKPSGPILFKGNWLRAS